MKGTYFISGIDTDIGKSIATGWLAARLKEEGVCVTTQKMIQTGNESFSEDIELHRRIMQIPHTEEDKQGISCPIIFTYPASPHLAAKLDNRTVDTTLITQATRTLEERYEVVLLEGAGGLMVPLTEDLLTIDYVQPLGYPTILVTSGRLGSINHTLLSIEALLQRKMVLHSLIYNRYPACDAVIEQETLEFLERYLAKVSPHTQLLVMDKVSF